MEQCLKLLADGYHRCGSYAINEHKGSNRCDRCFREDRGEAAELEITRLKTVISKYERIS